MAVEILQINASSLTAEHNYILFYLFLILASKWGLTGAFLREQEIWRCNKPGRDRDTSLTTTWERMWRPQDLSTSVMQQQPQRNCFSFFFIIYFFVSVCVFFLLSANVSFSHNHFQSGGSSCGFSWGRFTSLKCSGRYFTPWLCRLDTFPLTVAKPWKSENAIVPVWNGLSMNLWKCDPLHAFSS